MLCQQCQKRLANVHYTQIINGKRVELYLCQHCVNEKGQLGIGSQLNLGDFLWGLHSLGDNINFQKPEAPKEVRCPVCNMSFSEFRKTGRLGCSNCYSVFSNELKPILRRIHGSIEHRGKIPVNDQQCGEPGLYEKIKKTEGTEEEQRKKIDRNVEKTGRPQENCDELGRLKNELSEAIKGEEYERAAVIRDRIRELEGTGNTCGGVNDDAK